MNAHLDRLGCVSEELGITIGFDEVLNDFSSVSPYSASEEIGGGSNNGDCSESSEIVGKELAARRGSDSKLEPEDAGTDNNDPMVVAKIRDTSRSPNFSRSAVAIHRPILGSPDCNHRRVHLL